ncbi:MAG: hypothetical protein ACFE85_05365 [Candidatus Hodarchaeota archaeon]
MIFSTIQDFTEAWRIFEYDYIYIDGIFFISWVLILIRNKKWNPLKFGIFTSIIIYFIDAVFWWTLPAGSNYPPGTTIREYWIGGVKVPTNYDSHFWPKFGADFMMIFSYSIFIFPWLWIMFENFVKRNKREIVFYTVFFFTAWFLTPFLSFLLPIDDTIVETVRHMNTQFITWIVNASCGYILLFIIYGTNWFRSKDLKVIGFIFILGILGSFFMEFPLFITGIRPTGILFLLYELAILFNQGAPYLYILYDKIFPFLNDKILKRKRKTEKELEVPTTI